MLPVRTSLFLAVSALALMIPHDGHAASPSAPTPLLLTNEGPESAMDDLPLSPVPAPQKTGNVAASVKPAAKPAESAKNKPMTAPMPKSVLTPQQMYWEVKQSTLPDGFYEKNVKAPCLATKRQVQGNLIQMSAHQHRLYSLSFDADDLGVPAQRDIPVTLIFDRDPKPLQLMGQALTPMTVTVTMLDPAAVYARMENASYLTALVRLPDGQSHQLRYDVTGIRTAFAEMERCSSEGQASAAASVPVPTSLEHTAAGEAPAAVLMSSAVPARVRRAEAIENGRALPPPIWPGETPADIVAVEPKSRAENQNISDNKRLSVPDPAAVVSEKSAENTLKREEIRVLGAKPDSELSSGVMASKAASRMPLTVKDVTAQSVPVVSSVSPNTVSASAPAQAPEKIVRSYRARPGESMRDVVRRWTERDGVDLVWAMPRDVTLSKEFSYTGELQTALTMLLSTYPEAGAKTTLAPKGVEIDKKPYIEESKAPAIPPETVKGVPLDEFVVPTPPPSDAKPVGVPAAPAARAAVTPQAPAPVPEFADVAPVARAVVPRHIPSRLPPPPKRVIAPAPMADAPEMEKAALPPIPEPIMPIPTPRQEPRGAAAVPTATPPVTIPMRAPAPPPSSSVDTADAPSQKIPGTALQRTVHDLYADVPAEEEVMDGMAMDVEVPSFDATPAPIPMNTDRAMGGAAVTPPPMPPVPARAVPVPAPIPMEQEDIDLEQMAAQMVPLHTPSKTAAGPVVTAKQAAVGPVKRWRALTGASLQQVMKAWAEESGTNLIWMSSTDFAVKYSVNKNADYGQAVADLLGQYTFEPVRPLGQLYQDPQTGQRTLVIR